MLRSDTTAEFARAGHDALLRPLFWLQLVGIVLIGIAIGLFATSMTMILLSGSAVGAADYTGGSVPRHSPESSTGLTSLRFDERSR
jgi:hypothetical protein